MMISGALSSWSRFETVVAVDDAAIQVVKIAGREASTVEREPGA